MKARAVLLGASNLTLGLRSVLEVARSLAGKPVDVLAALGHGRSYGAPTRVLFRGLPGITGCGLWDRLGSSPAVPTFALVTDVGNDIPHGVPTERIASWVETCLARLEQAGSRTALTLLPVRSLERLGRLRYLTFRTVLFPASRMPLEEVLRRARDLNERLRVAAAHRGASVVELEPEWYGLDPIHVRRRHRRGAWARILSPWAFGEDRDDARAASRVEPLGALPRLRPEAWSIFGRARSRTQPCARLADGGTIALY